MRPETQAWVEDAEYDLQSAKAMLDSGRYFFVVFMCHLTIEKLLKSVIIEWQGIEPPKIHNLFGLIARAGLTIPPERRPLINELDNYECGHPLPRRTAGNRQYVDRREYSGAL
jgi:HEPN domain-containing protein